jgi:hypothetical protein
MTTKQIFAVVLFMILFEKTTFAQPDVITIPGLGHIAYGISPTGKYVTGIDGSGGAFLYKVAGGAFTNIGGDDAYAVTDNGKVVGTYRDPAHQFNGISFPIAGFYENGSWSTPGLIPGMVPFSSSQYSYGFGISDDGSALCGMVWENAGKTRAFKWDATNLFTILKDQNQSAKAMCLSGDGKVAGGWVQGNNRLPYIWKPDSVLLDPTVGEVHSINYNGSRVAGVANGSAFILDSINGMQYIPTIVGANNANAWGVSDSGIVVGNFDSGSLPPYTKTAFIYIPGQGMLNLRDFLIQNNATNVPPALDVALGISRDGKYIIAYGGFPRTNYIIKLDSLSTGIYTNHRIDESILIHPNPVNNGIINMTGQLLNNSKIYLTDVTGREVYSGEIAISKTGEFTFSIDLNKDVNSKCPPGTYFITMISSGNKITRLVIVK